MCKLTISSRKSGCSIQYLLQVGLYITMNVRGGCSGEVPIERKAGEGRDKGGVKKRREKKKKKKKRKKKKKKEDLLFQSH